MNAKHQKLLMVAAVYALGTYTPRSAYAEGPPNRCTMLTQAQISAVIGASVGAGVPIDTTGCSWSADPTAHTPHMVVTVAVWPGSAFAGMKAPIAPLVKTPVSGIGDDAVSTRTANFMALSVKKGNMAFILRVYGVPDPAKQSAIEKALALDILARL
jgi:hypothetical protein